MSIYPGRDVAISAGVESTPGSSATIANSFPLAHEGVGYETMIDTKPIEAGLGVLDKIGDVFTDMESSGGSLPILMDSSSLGVFLAYLFGNCTTRAGTGDNSGRHTHTFTQGNNYSSVSRRAITFFKRNRNLQEKFVKTRLSAMTFNFVQDSVAKLNMEAMGYKGVANTDNIPPYNQALAALFRAKDLVFKIAATTGDLSSASNILLKTLDIKWENDLVKYGTTGSTAPQETPSTGFMITLDCVGLYDNNDIRNVWENKNRRVAQISINGKDAVGGHIPSFTANFPVARVIEWESKPGLGDIAEQTFKIQIIFNGSQTWNAVLVNNVATGKYGQ